MSDREREGDVPTEDSHSVAAETFVSRTNARFDDEIVSVFVFGSTARGETATLASDVDVLVVLSDDVDRESIEDELRDIAYDVMLEYGPVVELHLLTQSKFEQLRERRNPFVQSAVHEGRSYG